MPEGLVDVPPLKSHVTRVDGPNHPSDRFLRLHFQRCLVVYACGGDISEDYSQDDIDDFMDELGVFDGEMDSRDVRWTTLLGIEVHSYLLRERLGCVPYLYTM
jgi:hypothetical protein